MKHVKHVLVVFESDYCDLNSVDMFDVELDVSLKYFIDNFESFGHVGYSKIVSAHEIKLSYSPEFSD